MEDLKGYLQEFAKNGITKSIATTKGIIAAFISLIIMACLSIYFGAFRSISHLRKIKSSEERIEVMKVKDAAIFPLILSCFLVGLYISLRFSVTFHNSISTYTSIFLTVCVLGTNILHLARILKPYVFKLIPQDFQVHHCLVLESGSESQFNLHFETADIITLGICSVIAGIYLSNKHWILSNIFGIAIAINDIEFWQLNSFINGCVLLGGLLVYDVFWVFATDIMSNVARSIEAPVVLIFPQDVFKNWRTGTEFTMLGLGDVIIPGIFIALLLRFDENLKRGQKLYFYSSLIAYILGLVVTIVICSVFKRGQPAMLYLVPACIGIPGAIAFLKGDLNALLQYRDYPEEYENINQ